MSVIRIPRPDEDRPNLALLAAIAIVFVGVGVGLARWAGPRTAAHVEEGPAALDRDALEAAALANAAAAIEVSTAEPAPLALAPETVPSPSEGADAVIAPAATVPEVPREEEEEEAHEESLPPRRPVRLIRGRVAYLRCDGVPQRPGPIPCPRDEPFEQSAWDAIATLRECETRPEAPGWGDVVLAFEGSDPPEVRVRDRFADDIRRLDQAALEGCLAGPLASVRSQMGSTRLVVSFRFALE